MNQLRTYVSFYIGNGIRLDIALPNTHRQTLLEELSHRECLQSKQLSHSHDEVLRETCHVTLRTLRVWCTRISRDI